MMAFHGGPLDGTTKEPEEGWPAPDAYVHEDFEGRYVRIGVSDGGVHHYAYEGPE